MTCATMSDLERRQQPLAPALKFAGGKRWLLPRLGQLYSGHRQRRLVEPFVGGMSVALGLRPDRALLADACEPLVNFHRWAQRGLKVEIAFESTEDFYYRARGALNEWIDLGCPDSAIAAQLFMYLNKLGFNGLCRFNGKGHFNVPYGKYKTWSYVDDFREYTEALRDWQIVCCDFEELAVQPGDFVYCDPPYDVEFTKYSRLDFTWADQERLVRWLGRHDGPVVASNQATERALTLYRRAGFEIELLDAPRRISCTGDRAPAKEMLAWRNL